MNYIQNPVLKGFNPDPSILRVGEDYYIATSTFEWFPGVQIHHSKDLVHWKLIARPLNRLTQLNMQGNICSGGIWAPCLTYDKGIFYLIYTDVKTKGTMKDTHNYLVTSKEITGDWSDPIYLNSSGFDPSLFHDDDGRKYLVNMLWDHRQGKNPFSGILLQEYSPEQQRLIGKPINIFKGTELGKTEGPHLYRHNGYYYLMTAEGGTGLTHAVTIARSKQITGPYEVDPQNPILTSRTDPTLPLQKSGHASLVETRNGEWYMAHLCSRPLPTKGRSMLGRETAIQKVIWTEDGWIRLEHGGNHPEVQVPAPALEPFLFEREAVLDHFDSPKLNIHFQTLRIPLGEDQMSLTERPGFLRLKGKESLISAHRQSLVARRQQAFRYTAETCLEYEPETFQQMAGLICWHDEMNFFYLHVTHDEKFGVCMNIMQSNNGRISYPLADPISLQSEKNRYYLKVTVHYDMLQFSYSMDGERWMKIGGVLDNSILSDEYSFTSGFTGAFVGICCQDMSGMSKHADFDYFQYIEEKE